jgi:hypothetical protein
LVRVAPLWKIPSGDDKRLLGRVPAQPDVAEQAVRGRAGHRPVSFNDPAERGMVATRD